MKDVQGKIIYVGKGKNLRSRVASYFRRSGDQRPLIPSLIRRVRDIDYIVTDTEKEALLLEINLIKKHHPAYNVCFRDDKTYYHLRLDRRLPYPRPRLVRRPKRDGALYFGPFASSRKLKSTLRYLQKIFPFRTCSDNIFKHRSRPCFYHELRLCLTGHQDTRMIGRLNPISVPGIQGNIGKDPRRLRWFIIGPVLHLEIEDAPFGKGVLLQGTVDQGICPTTCCVAILP